LAASTNSATERPRSSRIVEKAETGLSDNTSAAAGGLALTISRLAATLHRETFIIASILVI
jgi:hypothetical protein